MKEEKEEKLSTYFLKRVEICVKIPWKCDRIQRKYMRDSTENGETVA